MAPNGAHSKEISFSMTPNLRTQLSFPTKARATLTIVQVTQCCQCSGIVTSYHITYLHFVWYWIRNIRERV